MPHGVKHGVNATWCEAWCEYSMVSTVYEGNQTATAVTVAAELGTAMVRQAGRAKDTQNRGDNVLMLAHAGIKYSDCQGMRPSSPILPPPEPL
jgi:hypothetical protein